MDFFTMTKEGAEKGVKIVGEKADNFSTSDTMDTVK